MTQFVQKALPARIQEGTVEWAGTRLAAKCLMARPAPSLSRVRSARDLSALRPHSDSSCPLPNSPFGKLTRARFRAIGPLSQPIDSIGGKRFAKPRPQKWLKTKDFRRHGSPLLANPQVKSFKTLGWRPEPESNRRARICSPLRNHSAIGPGNGGAFVVSFASGSTPNASSAHLSMNGSWRGFPPLIYGLLVSVTIGCDFSLNFRCVSGISQS